MFTHGFGQMDPASIQAQLDDWTRTLDGLNRTLVIAKQANNQAMLAQVRSAISYVLRQVVALHAALVGQEVPSGVMMAFSTFSDAALTIAKDVGGVPLDLLKATGDIAKGVGATAKMLPLILVGLLAVLGIGLYKGSLGVQVRR